MVPIQVVMIAGGLTLAVWGGTAVVHAAKRATHALVHKLHHQPAPEGQTAAQPAGEEKKQ